MVAAEVILQEPTYLVNENFLDGSVQFRKFWPGHEEVLGRCSGWREGGGKKGKQ